MIKKGVTITKILTNVFVLSFGVFFVGRMIALENKDAINSFLNAKTFQTVDKDGNVVKATYFDSDFKSIAEVKKNAKKVTEQVTDEGIVLLKNDNALPLRAKAKVNAYSISSVSPVFSGTGSSGTSASTAIDFKTALSSHFTINEDLFHAYDTLLASKKYGRGASSGIGASFSIHEPTWSLLPESKNEEAEAGIFFLARNGGEGNDLDRTSGDKSDLKNGNYLLLSDAERDVLSNMKALKEKGKLSKIIVFMNSANPVQVDFLDEFSVDALLWSSTLGETGAQSFADILVGEVNPSGKTVDTFFKRNDLNPVYSNFGDYTYQGTKVSDLLMSNKYVVYQEGIYNGYRYAETRYEDKVLNRGNPGDYNYSDVVAYPFGYGLSYSEFAYSDFRVTEGEDDDYKISVTVKNVSQIEGKTPVQLYVQKAYNPELEKASVELIDFKKTKLLKPKESEEISFDVKKEELTSYDAKNASTYVLDQGDYYFTIGRDAHDAINNILLSQGKTSSDGLVSIGRESLGEKTLSSKVTIEETDTSSYSLGKNGDEITNQFDDVDINKYENRGDNSVTYVSRFNWAQTVKYGFDKEGNDLHNQVVLTGNDDMANDASYYNSNGMEEDEESDFPAYGSTKTDYDLIDLRVDEEGKPIAYDDKKWDDLLDQLTLQEQVDLLSSGLRSTGAIESISKPGTIDHNGATGPMMSYNVSAGTNRGLAVTNNDKDQKQKPIAYPSNSMAAATFNRPLMETYGQTWGEDCLWAGYSGLYGPAVNIHRGSYGGRAFEYYSEDPVLSGKISASMIKGISSKGVYVYLKHCFLNEQETNREGVNTWANEQSIREIYLKPFKIAIQEGGCQNVMTGFNRLGTLWTGNHGFLNKVLRNEYGMKGFAVSDFYHKEYMNLSSGIYNGNDLPDGQADSKELKNNAELYAGLAKAMRESVHRILYIVVNSNAMNNMVKGTHIEQITPVWIILLNTITISFGVLSILSVAGLVFFLVFKRKAAN